MSFDFEKAVWAKSEAEGTTLLTLIYLAYRANDQGVCWPGIAKIAEETKTSKMTAIRNIKKLEVAGELKVDREKGRVNKYQILVSNCDQSQNDTSHTGDTITSHKMIPHQSQNDTSPVTPVLPEPSYNHQRTTNRTTNRQKVEIPASLNTPEFLEAWQEFRDYRIEKRNKMTPSTEKKQLKKLSVHSPHIAIQMIETTIANGWTGIFELNNGNGRSKPKPEKQGFTGRF